MMKRLVYIILIVIGLTAINGCKKNLVDLNDNPNESVWVNPEFLFKQSLIEGAGNYNSDVNVEQWSLMNWVMYMATRGGVIPGNEYVVPSGKDAFWNEQYANALTDINQAIILCSDSSKYINLKAAGEVWKVFLFHRITDLWGAIPYSEALKGYSDLNYSPKYDSQKDIYSKMLLKLKQASENLDSSKEFVDASCDLIFNGDVEKWRKFANSLRLRLATRIRFSDPVLYQTTISELLSEDLIDDNQDCALFPFNSLHLNHLYAAYDRNEAVNQNNPSKFFVDMMVSTNDPRVKIFFTKTPLYVLPMIPDYNGVPNLLPNNSPVWDNYDFNNDGQWSDISRIGTWFLRPETPGVFMSYAEVCFLKAEAASMGLWPGDALVFLKEGIRANIEFYGAYGTSEHVISETDINGYLSTITEASLEEIITQKWISFAFENGYEAYAEYRRTGFPVLLDYYGQPINKDVFPVRFLYPNSETTLNRENYMEAVSSQGPDEELTKIWWDID